MRPLIHQQDDKQRRHAEINARQVEWQRLPNHRAQHRAQQPVNAAQDSHIEHNVLPVGIIALQAAIDRIAFIGHGADHIGHPAAHGAEIADKAEAVKGLSAVHQQRRHGHQAQACAPSQQRYQHKLKRAGIHNHAGQQRRIPRIAVFRHQHAIGHADKHIAA